MCTSPIPCWAKKSPNENGRYESTWKISEADIDKPRNHPCGRCFECLKRKARQKGLQIQHEVLMAGDSTHSTLTYDDEHLPPTMEAAYKDFQLFIRSLRRHFDNKVKFRHATCVERGDAKGRIHLHSIIFGHDFYSGNPSIGKNQFEGVFLERFWKRGFVCVTPVVPETAFYVAGHHQKVMASDDFIFHSSIKLGKEFGDKFIDDAVRCGFFVVAGQKYGIPDIYKRWFQDELQLRIEEQQEYQRCRSPDDRWQERVSQAAREINARAREGLRKRKL